MEAPPPLMDAIEPCEIHVEHLSPLKGKMDREDLLTVKTIEPLASVFRFDVTDIACDPYFTA